jgi:hexosaminidase
MNRLVDAARPESESVRALEAAATRVAAKPAATKPDVATLRREFARWSANDAQFQELAAHNPLLAELLPLSHDLAELGSAGAKALDAVAAGRHPDPALVTRMTKDLTRMEKPQAELNLAATRVLRALLKIPKK